MASIGNSVLVIDSDPAVCALLVALLQREGYTADVAEDAGKALQLRRHGRHNAIIVEPRIDGGDALLEQLHDGATNLIVVTTPDGPPPSPYEHTRGVHAVLFKPFEIGELAAAVASCCDAN
jgi:DNA-binding response OmpR family regulator